MDEDAWRDGEPVPVLLRALPFPEPDRIVSFVHTAPQLLTSLPEYVDYRGSLRSFESLAAFAEVTEPTPTVLPDPPLQPQRPGEPPAVDIPEPPDPAEPWEQPEPPQSPTPRPPALPPDDDNYRPGYLRACA